MLLALLGGLFTLGAAFVPVLWADDDSQDNRPTAQNSVKPGPTDSPSTSASGPPPEPSDEEPPSPQPSTTKETPPETVLRTETFALAGGYGFNLEDEPLRPTVGDTSSDYDVVHSEDQDSLGVNFGAKFVLLPEETRRATYETCKRQSGFEIWVDLLSASDSTAPTRKVCVYAKNGVTGLIEFVREDRENPTVKVTLWQGTSG